jgi:hypothetical protein
MDRLGGLRLHGTVVSDSLMRPELLVAAILIAASLSAAAPPGKPSDDHPAIQEYLNHPGFTWRCQRSGHFEYCFDPKLKSDPNLITVRKGAEEARRHILRLAATSNSKPAIYKPIIHVFFLDSRARMKELIGYDGEGRSRPTQHVVFFVLTPVRPDLTHELCHEIISNLWGAAEPWIEEGLATYAAEGGFHHDLQSWLDADQIMPLEKLVNPDWNPSQYSPDVTYVELAGFVEYLKNTYGLESIRQIWRFGSQGITGVFGKPLAELEADWRTALKR